MGSEFHTWSPKEVKETDTKKLLKEYNSYVEYLQHEYGHNPYNGTFSTCGGGLRITDRKFIMFDDAEQWLMDNHDKWDSPLAVKVFIPKKGWIGSKGEVKLVAKYHALIELKKQALRGEGGSVKAIQKRLDKLQETRKLKAIEYTKKKFEKSKKPNYRWVVGGWCAC